MSFIRGIEHTLISFTIGLRLPTLPSHSRPFVLCNYLRDTNVCTPPWHHRRQHLFFNMCRVYWKKNTQCLPCGLCGLSHKGENIDEILQSVGTFLTHAGITETVSISLTRKMSTYYRNHFQNFNFFIIIIIMFCANSYHLKHSEISHSIIRLTCGNSSTRIEILRP